MPKIELRRKGRKKQSSSYLTDFAHNTTSQFGEDGILEKVFETIGVKHKWCVEFGAWDGKYLSNTWKLINKSGWAGVLIEGDAERARRLAESHAVNRNRVFVEQAYVGWEGEATLDAILAKTPTPTDFDLLSIDIDGNDWHVWSALERYKPRVVVVEFNPSASNDLYFIQDRDPQINQGSSLLAFVELARIKGYELAAATLANGIFVIAEEFYKLGIEDNSIDAMHEPAMELQICQGYDGTIFGAGHMWLTWHQIQLTQDDLQILPKGLRKYPDPGEK